MHFLKRRQPFCHQRGKICCVQTLGTIPLAIGPEAALFNIFIIKSKSNAMQTMLEVVQWNIAENTVLESETQDEVQILLHTN